MNSTANVPPRLIMLPGMGTRAPLLEPQKREFPTLETPNWVRNRFDDEVGDYAQRLLETVDTSGSFYLSGVSFGGMVALEMARHCKPKAVLLIGSARTGAQVPRSLTVTAKLGRRLPLWLLRFQPKKLIRAHLAYRERLEEEHLELLNRATQGADQELFRWTGAAITRWRFDGELDVPIYQIHGDEDWILHPPPPGEHVEIIPGGRHMIHFTHAEEVNRFIHRHAPDVPYTPISEAEGIGGEGNGDIDNSEAATGR